MKILAAILIMVASAGAQEAQPAQNAYWWNQLSRPEKTMFVIGYITSMGDASVYVKMACQDGRGITIHPDKAATIIAICDETQQLKQVDYRKIAAGQIADGIDTFYKDFRNKSIYIGAAAEYVRDELKGATKTELESEIKTDRLLWNN